MYKADLYEWAKSKGYDIQKAPRPTIGTDFIIESDSYVIRKGIKGELGVSLGILMDEYLNQMQIERSA